MEKVLRVRGLKVKYPGSDWVLKGVDLDLGFGETVIIVGDSGSGKTTLVRALTGIAEELYNAVVEGRVEIGGQVLKDRSWKAFNKRVKVVCQNPKSNIVYPVVFDDLLSYATEIYGSTRLAEREIANVSKILKITHLLNRSVNKLSGGELRRVAIAKAMLSKPDIIIFDEPLMWLDDRGVLEFRKALEVLKINGISSIILEHKYKSLIDLADKLYLLNDGVLHDFNPEDDMSPTPPPGDRITKRSGETVVSLKNIYLRMGDVVFRGLNLEARRGDKIAIYGLNGAGKTTLLKVIAGIVKPDKGSIVRSTSMLYIPQIPYLFFTEYSIMDEVNSLARNVDAVKLFKELGFRGDSGKTPYSLSWGEAVKLSISLSLISKHELILLDEPFSGLSYKDRLRYGEMLANSEKTIIVTTSSLENLRFLPGFKRFELSDGIVKELKITGV
ncbi:ATP-binding cassette domain-containing protein [Thermogladius sp. 4427co]|uniref:ATP-binding cassette domain-containing protein n=1 Tax=Thermogladius sp. 4427co TaxID=3450718 RepID=UPI003F7B033C